MKKGFVLSVFLVSLIIVFAGFGSAALTLKNTTSSYFGASNDPAVFSSGSYMYIVYPGSLDIYDISNPVSPVLKSKTAAGANPTAVVVRGDYAYVQSWSGSWGEAMFRIWNVSNPSDPKVLGSFATNGMRLDVVGNYAYVSDHGGSIRIINITNPTNPTLAGSAAAISYIGDIKVVGNYAYVAVQTPGELQIFDVSNPASPQSVSHVATEGSNLGLDVVGNYAYVVNYISASKTNLIIFDVSNPASPQVVGRYIPAIDETYADIEVKDNIAYISTFGTTGKIKAFDVSNPASPLLLQTENTEVSGQNLYASGNYVYLVESNYQAGGSFFKIYDRGFTYGQYGDGRDNKLTVANQNTIVNKYARITSSSLSAGSTTIGVNSALGFAAGDEILIIQMQNGVGSSGQYEYRTISRVIGNNIVVPALTNSYYSGNFNTVNANAAQIVRIPHYTTLTVNSGASITAQAWDGYTGGIVAFRVSDTLTLNGVINVTGKGFRGGDLAGSNSGYQGESYKGKGIISPFNNSGGGGGGSNLGGAIDNHPGGGGGYGTEGGIGSSYLSRNGGTCTEKAGCMGLEINPAYTPDYLRGRGGLVYGDDSGSNVFLGSGGGASSNVNWGQATGCINGPGGNGAGAVIIYSSQISGNGKILSVGNKGEDGNGACTGWYGAGGGGGSGGAIMVVSSSNTPVNSLNISGGAPGASVTNGVINVDRGGLGGVGGLGRILSLVVGHPCDPDQTIMSIYSQNNTHAALWNDTDYNYKICYTDFFPEYTGADPHDCQNGKNVLYMSKITNAHIGSVDSGYTVPVCYGDLSCNIRTSCISGETQIATVSGTSNAHIASDGSLPYKLCCTTAPAAATMQWRNYYEKALSEGSINISKAGANWTVKAVYSQAGLTGNVEFKIYKDGTISDDLVATINATAVNGVAKANWPILSNSTGAYYFIVGSSDHSPTLNVQTMAGNKPPVANITSPVSGQIYFTGNSISINQDSYDEEGPLLITEWNVSESSFDKNAWSGNVIYAVAGSKPIKLIVRDKNNAEAYDEAAILVLPTDGSSVTRAFINSPKIMEHFLNYGIVSVPFNGSESFVVSSSSSPCSVTCLSGKCPSQTTGIPACSSVVLNVLNAPTSTVSYEGLTFGWTFVDGGVRRTPTEQQSKIAGNQLFAGVYTNTMELSLNYSAGGVSSTDTFVREFYLEDRMQCTIENGKAYFKEILGGVSTRYDAMVTAKCAGMDNIAGTGDDCCPFGQSGQTWACSDGTGSIVAGCYIKSEKAPECADYATQSTCMNDTSNAARYGLASQKYNCGENVDGKVIDCSCMWTASACSLNYTSYGEVPVNNEPVVDKSCVRNIVASEPLNGRITYTAQIVGDATGCTGPNSFSLPVMNRITLPVFGWVQALVAVIAIFIIYLIYELVKDRKGKKGKSKTNLNRRKSRR